MANAAIELKNITKTFGNVVANKDVSLVVNRGEILSILGENGSGKTTLMNMIPVFTSPMKVAFSLMAKRLLYVLLVMPSSTKSV